MYVTFNAASLEIEGVGDDYKEAIIDASRRGLSPTDAVSGAESWEAAYEAGWRGCDNWNTLDEQDYRDKLAEEWEEENASRLRSVLDSLADVWGVFGGTKTRKDLADFAESRLPANPKGTDYDAVIAEFLAIRNKTLAAEEAAS